MLGHFWLALTNGEVYLMIIVVSSSITGAKRGSIMTSRRDIPDMLADPDSHFLLQKPIYIMGHEFGIQRSAFSTQHLWHLT
jgi:hypothetical protein